MLAKIQSAAVVGISAIPVTVEVDVADGLPGITIVGLPDTAVKESKDRIRSAIKNTQYMWPQSRITVNLAPADVKKEGSAFDFPIALGLLAASRQLDQNALSDVVVLGELALDGSLRPVPGALPVALSLKGKAQRLLLPSANAPEAAVAEKVSVYPIQHLHQAVSFLKSEEKIEPCVADLENLFRPALSDGMDLSEVKGQHLAKRALEVAVAGGHNILLMGPPGGGKTMLARRIPTIIPQMSLEEALETTQVYSVVGLLSPEQPLVMTRPFRSPHHTISETGAVASVEGIEWMKRSSSLPF